MSGSRPFASPPGQGHVAGWLSTAVLCLTAIVAPLALGGTHALATLGIQVAMAAVVFLWVAFFRPAMVPLAISLGALALPFLQLLPLPDRPLMAIAPVSAGAWKVSHAGMPDAWGRISIDPAETAAAARRAMLLIGTAAAVAELSLRRPFRNCLVAALACSGAVIWGLGIAFPVEPNSFRLLGFISFKGPLMPGRTPLEAPVATAAFGYPEIIEAAGYRYSADSWIVGDGFGPYLVTNHFAGALTLTVPFLVASWLYVTSNRFPTWLRAGVAAVTFTAAAATIALLVESRAGTASCLMAIMVFAWMVSPAGRWQRAARWATLAYTGVLIAFITAIFGPFQGIETWFPAMLRPKVAGLLSDGRVVATRVGERMFLSSPLLGTGLGTYGDLYPKMVRDGVPWYFAHNDYVQLLAEAGIAGLAFAAVPITILSRAAMTFGHRATGAKRFVGAAAWAAVSGIAVHSWFDWNLRVPANGFLACIAAGIALASQRQEDDQSRQVDNASWLRTAMAGALGVAVVATTGFLIRDAVSEVVQRQLREAIVAARLHATGPQGASPEQQLSRAIQAGKRMAAWDPGDAQLAAALGQASLHMSEMPNPIDDANAFLQQAVRWFQIARQNCAACRGIGESPLDSPSGSP